MNQPRVFDLLVIDDKARVRVALAETLRAAGHRVDVAADGESGLLRFAARRYDVVLTDVAMPGIDGWDVARAVRRARPDVGLVLLSGMFSESASVRDDQGLGAVTLLAKPVSLDALEAAIERAATSPGRSVMAA